MDNINCLENLTENIVKKQIDSIESIKNLSQAVDNVSSDISNLISSLLMVGNRQFAENRIQDDDSLLSEEQIVSDHQQMKHTKTHPQLNQQTSELTLGAILKKALELLPQSEDITDNECEELVHAKVIVAEDSFEDPLEETASREHAPEPILKDPFATLRQELESKYGSLSREPREARIERENLPVDSTPEPGKSFSNDIETAPNDEKNDNSKNSSERSDNNNSIQNSSTSINDRSSQYNQRANDNPENKSIRNDGASNYRSSRMKPSMDRDRVANILKKYSLYDDDEDDDEEEDYSE